MKKIRIKNLKRKVKNLKTLSNRQIFNGVRMSIKNAENLLDGAKILFRNKKFDISASMAVLAIEEFGKANMLSLSDVKLTSPLMQLVMWQNFREHDVKLSMAIPMAYLFNEKCLNFKKERGDSKSDKLVASYNKIKKQGLYVDFDEKKNRFVAPSGIIKSKMAKDLIDFVHKTLKLYRKLGIAENYKNFLKLLKAMDDEAYLRISSLCSQ
ncbi:MAG: AbiV family abortive infection protein [Patescibacteria group bacterium]|nr:AbiV family abortive infection protein [Patescibacteria group bacterium]